MATADPCPPVTMPMCTNRPARHPKPTLLFVAALLALLALLFALLAAFLALLASVIACRELWLARAALHLDPPGARYPTGSYLRLRPLPLELLSNLGVRRMRVLPALASMHGSDASSSESFCGGHTAASVFSITSTSSSLVLAILL